MTEKTKPSEGSLLRRWSRLKSEAREKENAKPATGSVGAHAVPVTLHSGTDVAASRGEQPAAGPAQAPAVADATPSLPPVESLTIDSDFAPFLQPKVDEALKRRALKQLFRDSHFNVMDGLDVYIDDYSKPDPLPPAMLKQLASARFLNLVDEEEEEEEEPEQEKQKDEPQGSAANAPGREVADDPAAQSVAQSPQNAPDVEAPSHHADPDLRLQQDHAPGRAGPGQGSR